MASKQNMRNAADIRRQLENDIRVTRDLGLDTALLEAQLEAIVRLIGIKKDQP